MLSAVSVLCVCAVCLCHLKAREYTRALTAVKLDKMFARPLVGALDGHGDGVFCSAASRKNLVQFISGMVKYAHTICIIWRVAGPCG